MEQRATIFVEVMIVIAVIGVLAFLIGLIVRMPQRQQAAANGKGQAEPSPRWYEFTLALILLAAIAAFAIWLISSGTHWVWGETIEDWRSDDRTIAFAAVMVALAVIGLVVSLVYALVQSSQGAAAQGVDRVGRLRTEQRKQRRQTQRRRRLSRRHYACSAYSLWSSRSCCYAGSRWRPPRNMA